MLALSDIEAVGSRSPPQAAPPTPPSPACCALALRIPPSPSFLNPSLSNPLHPLPLHQLQVDLARSAPGRSSINSRSPTLIRPASRSDPQTPVQSPKPPLAHLPCAERQKNLKLLSEIISCTPAMASPTEMQNRFQAKEANRRLTDIGHQGSYLGPSQGAPAGARPTSPVVPGLGRSGTALGRGVRVQQPAVALQPSATEVGADGATGVDGEASAGVQSCRAPAARLSRFLSARRSFGAAPTPAGSSGGVETQMSLDTKLAGLSIARRSCGAAPAPPGSPGSAGAVSPSCSTSGAPHVSHAPSLTPSGGGGRLQGQWGGSYACDVGELTGDEAELATAVLSSSPGGLRLRRPASVTAPPSVPSTRGVLSTCWAQRGTATPGYIGRQGQTATTTAAAGTATTAAGAAAVARAPPLQAGASGSTPQCAPTTSPPTSEPHPATPHRARQPPAAAAAVNALLITAAPPLPADDLRSAGEATRASLSAVFLTSGGPASPAPDSPTAPAYPPSPQQASLRLTSTEPPQGATSRAPSPCAALPMGNGSSAPPSPLHKPRSQGASLALARMVNTASPPNSPLTSAHSPTRPPTPTAQPRATPAT